MKLGPHVSGLLTKRHGAGCCGISHLYDFPTEEDEGVAIGSVAEKIGWIRSAVADALHGGVEGLDVFVNPERVGHAVEVVLADYQLDEWREALEAVGFKEVFSFFNVNSYNVCNVFYLNTSEKNWMGREPEEEK